MSELEEKELAQKMKALSAAEQEFAIKYFHDEVLLGELRNRLALVQNIVYLVKEMLEGRKM